MFGPFPPSQYLPCPECGASVPTAAAADHVCSEERRLDYQLFLLRDEIAGLDREVAGYLDSPQGRFELWYAARERLRCAA